jgi:phosphate starvation-inducible PhoH-like protein
MGQNARIVVTGDVTQVDLPVATKSGLADAVERLVTVQGVATVVLDRSDIVRHPLVQAIVNAYEEEESARDRDARGDQMASPKGHQTAPGGADTAASE